MNNKQARIIGYILLKSSCRI